MKEVKLLPLGSAVRLKDNENIYIIISRGCRRENNQLVIGYAGVPHPYGQNRRYKSIVITPADIEEVVQKGYEDDQDQIYFDEQSKLATTVNIENNQVTKERSQNIDVRPKEDLKKEPEKNDYDPFYLLKSKK